EFVGSPENAVVTARRRMPGVERLDSPVVEDLAARDDDLAGIVVDRFEPETEPNRCHAVSIGKGGESGLQTRQQCVQWHARPISSKRTPTMQSQYDSKTGCITITMQRDEFRTNDE